MGEKSNGIKALRFQYRKGVAEHSFETMPFYLKTLRSFLWENRGKVVWLKGGIIEQPAYLVFYASIKDKVIQMLSQPLADLGKFLITPVENPIETVRKYIKRERVALGWLKFGQYELGSSETVEPSKEVLPILEKVRNGFLTADYLFIKAADVEIKGEWAILKNVVELGLSKGSKIAYVHKQDKLGIRVKDLNSIQPT